MDDGLWNTFNNLFLTIETFFPDDLIYYVYFRGDINIYYNDFILFLEDGFDFFFFLELEVLDEDEDLSLDYDD